MNRLNALAAAAVTILGVSAGSASAVPIELDFSFDGVSGTFFGLDSSVTDIQAATSLNINGKLDTYSAIPAGTFNNAFVFDQGALLSVSFSLFFVFSGDGGSTFLEAFEFLDPSFCDDPFCGGMLEFRGSLVTASSGPVTFTVREIAPIPLPAGGLLMLSGLGMAALYRRKTRTA
jgi:hypothetical protein